MDIELITADKKRFLRLLLLGDEQESMIDRYLEQGKMYVGSIRGHAMAVCVVSRINDSTMEVNNLAVDTPWQRKGFGRTMLQHVEGIYAGHTILIGTGETPENIAFYTACGYSFSHRIPDFFTANYDHPVVDNGVTLKDMIYMKKETPRKP